MRQQSTGKIKITFKESMGLLGPYVRDRLLAQIKSVWLIITYLILFQTLVLGIPIAEASIIALGIALVVAGLTFFMEGLFLGLMPLGELVGVRLPQKSNLVVILLFALVLGFLATLAEPAIAVLQTAGKEVAPWEAPLLFLLLSTHPDVLVYSVGIGVGVAVLFGMLRFIYNWSLKPFIYILVGSLSALTIYAYMEPNLLTITGLAWDCGAVTTGPVTVPLVLALGIGISRMVGGGDSSGFGVVTLASLFPIVAVLSLGLYFAPQIPLPMTEAEFFAPDNRSDALKLFGSEDELAHHALQRAGTEGMTAFIAGEGGLARYLQAIESDPDRKRVVFGSEADAIHRWVVSRGNEAWIALVYNGAMDTATADRARFAYQPQAPPMDWTAMLKRNAFAAVKAIGLLTLPLFLVLFIILREKLPRTDEIILGLVFAILGMCIFGIGIELGLDRLGGQVGQKLPSSFKAITLPESATHIENFSEDLLYTATNEESETYRFFYLHHGKELFTVRFNENDFDRETRIYSYIPEHGPLFGETERGLAGIVVVLIFAFIMGYGATLAEPALNALGQTVEELTVGTFKKSLLMQAVALGVGVGIATGVGKIIYDIPLMWLLIPPYMVLMLVTALSTEEFVNIGWDSAGVTTGPITVPLVLSMGLGIGSEVGATEGFGILAMASVCPILSVLIVGLFVTRKRRAALRETDAETQTQEVVAG